MSLRSSEKQPKVFYAVFSSFAPNSHKGPLFSRSSQQLFPAQSSATRQPFLFLSFSALQSLFISVIGCICVISHFHSLRYWSPFSFPSFAALLSFLIFVIFCNGVIFVIYCIASFFISLICCTGIISHFPHFAVLASHFHYFAVIPCHQVQLSFYKPLLLSC